MITLALACWRLTSLLARERGPFGVGTRFRKLFGIEHGDDGEPMFYEDDDEVVLNPLPVNECVEKVAHEVARGLTCMWCCSVWVGFALALLTGRRPLVPTALALSAVTILVEDWMERQ